MQEVESFLRTASRLHRLVGQIQTVVRESRWVRAYTPESAKFLEFVLSTGDRTRDFLCKLPQDKIKSGNDLVLEFLNGKIADLNHAWSLLHQFVKPVSDADTLHVPAPIVCLLNQCARKVLGRCLQVVDAESRDSRRRLAPWATWSG